MMRHGLLLLVLIALGGCASGGGKEKNEDLAGIYADIGVGYLQRGETARAEEKLKQALELDPKLPRAHHYIAELYSRQSKDKQAEEHYRQALELAPNDSYVKNNYAVFLCSRDRVPEAEKQFLSVIGDTSYRAPELVYENLGRCALRTADAAKAEQYFTKALQLRPNLPASLYEMARLQYDKREYFKARAFFERYLSVGQAQAEVLWLGVRIERALGNAAMVAKYGAALQEQFPDAKETALFNQLDSDSGNAPASQPVEPVSP